MKMSQVEAVAPAITQEATHQAPHRRRSRKNLQQNGPQRRYNVAFEHLKFTVGKKTIIHDCSGVVRAGELLTIMGPSGCGKTTLLSVIGNKTREYGRSARLEGSVLFNGQPVSARERRDLVSLVPQDPALFGDFTVDETMWFQARLYFGWRHFTRSQLKDKILATLSSLGIESCSSVRVGSLFHKGLSGGQKRRLSIAVELLTSPSVLLLDEPTTGLDSATALGILQEMLRLAACGHTLIATLHQPSSQMWTMLSNIMIMSSGYVIYSGPAQQTAGHFSQLGLVCPKRFNPSEFFLGIVTNDFQMAAFKHEYSLEQLAEKYSNSELYTGTVLPAIEQEKLGSSGSGQQLTKKSSFSLLSQLRDSNRSMKQVSLFSQFITLTMRNFANYRANIAIFILRIGAFVLLGIITGLIFLEAGLISGDPGVMASVSALMSTLIFFSFMSMAVIPFVIQDRLVFQRELKNGSYHKFPLVLSLLVISLFSTAAIALVGSILTVYMCRLSINLGEHFLILWTVLFYAEVFVFTMGAIFRHYIIGIAIATSWFATDMITAGVFVQISTVTWVLRWQSLVNPVFWAAKAFLSSEWPEGTTIEQGLLFPNSTAIYDFFDVNLYGIDGFWANWGLVLALTAGYALLFVLAVMLLW